MIPDTLRNGQQKLAEALVGKYVRFAHLPRSTPGILVSKATAQGMICLTGWAGEFAPHLFVVVEGVEKR